MLEHICARVFVSKRNEVKYFLTTTRTRALARAKPQLQNTKTLTHSMLERTSMKTSVCFQGSFFAQARSKHLLQRLVNRGAAVCQCLRTCTMYKYVHILRIAHIHRYICLLTLPHVFT